MRVEILGHASILVRGREGAVLFDPLFAGVHQEGVYDVHPPRKLDPSRMPAIDLLVVSHAHQDHFDLDTLAAMPRSLPIVIPKDPMLEGCLRALGFEEVYPVGSLDEVAAGDLRVVATPAAASGGTIEHGFLVIEGDTVLWNLVDTVPEPEGIARVQALYPRVDLALVPWQPLQDAEFQNGVPVQFPYAMYNRLLLNALQIGARAIVPGSCGFRARPPAEWTNHVIFPQTRARYVQDALAARPEWAGRILCADPGDAIEVDGEGATLTPECLPYCTREPSDWTDLEWRPDLLGFPMAEADPRFTRAEAEKAVGHFFEGALPAFVDEQPARFDAYRRWQVLHQYEVTFRDGAAWWLVDYRASKVRVTKERSPLALKRTCIQASALLGLVAGKRSWEYVTLSGAWRHHDHTYRVDDAGVHVPYAVSLRDPLRLMFPTEEAMTRKSLNQVAALLGAAPTLDLGVQVVESAD